MSLRTTAAVALGKLSGATSRRFGQGGGSALPGLLATALDGALVHNLAAQIPRGSVLITGTNGKTTTARMLATILQEAGLATLHNRTGSNLMRGLATTLIGEASVGGNLALRPDTVGLFEVDEFVLPQAVREIAPRAVVITNLFRDQLDRYGEVDLISARWAAALQNLPAASVAILNGDDPSVASLGRRRDSGVVYYGIDDDRHALPGLEHAADAKWCPDCNVNYDYALSFYGHLGHYACPRCDWRRPPPDVRARRVDLCGFAGTDLDLATPAGALALRLAVPGLYNVYNALAAATTALALGVPLSAVRNGLARVTAAFGRLERLTVDGRTVYLLLAKNPTGLNQVIRALLTEPGVKNLLFMLNDNIADGRDVSWIWDVDFERLAGHVRALGCAGQRAEDMALRLKLAGLLGTQPSPSRGRKPGGCFIERDTGRALEKALAQTPDGGTLFVVPTYTAMLDLRKELARRGHVGHFLESN